MKNFALNIKKQYLFGGVLIVVAMLVVGVLNMGAGDQNNNILNKSGEVERVDDNAFGDITSLATQESLSESVTRSEFGGGSSSDGAPAGAGPATADSIAPGEPYPEYSQVSYKYVGEDITLSEKADVYKRNKNLSYAQDIANKVQGINPGEFSISSLTNISLDSLRLSEEKQFGYSIFLNPREGQATISANWEHWPNNKNCNGPECVHASTERSVDAEFLTLSREGQRIFSEKNIDKNKVLGISNELIEHFSIDMSFYGEGEIRSVMFPEGYPPQNVSIVYPLNIEGKNVYAAHGDKVGIFSEVSMAHERVTHFGSIASNNFSVSSYDIETEAKRVIEIAEKGGLFGPRYFPVSENREAIVLELGTPKEILMNISRNNGRGEYEEFFVPALGFFVQNTDVLPEQSYFLDEHVVVVPLVKGFIDAYAPPGILPAPLDSMGGGSARE